MELLGCTLGSKLRLLAQIQTAHNAKLALIIIKPFVTHGLI